MCVLHSLDLIPLLQVIDVKKYIVTELNLYILFFFISIQKIAACCVSHNANSSRYLT